MTQEPELSPDRKLWEDRAQYVAGGREARLIVKLLDEIDRLNKERLGWMEIVRRLEPKREAHTVASHTVYEKTYTIEQVVAMDKENQALRACLDGIFKYCVGKPGNDLLAIRNTAAQALAPHAKKQDGGE